MEDCASSVLRAAVAVRARPSFRTSASALNGHGMCTVFGVEGGRRRTVCIYICTVHRGQTAG